MHETGGAGAAGRRSPLHWVQPLQRGLGPRYQQIARQVSDAVAQGVLSVGDRLPPQRELAQHLGVDLTTVTRAYAELRREGLLDAQGAGGSFVAGPATAPVPAVPSLAGPATLDLSMNIPPLLASPGFAQLQRAGSVQVQARAAADALMSYHVGAGAPADREAGARWLRPVLGSVEAQQVVVCAGAQVALAALLLAQTQPGDTVLTDPLTYPGFLAAARMLGRRVVAVPGDTDGMHPDALAQACATHQPSLLYLIPTIHNPTTVTLPAARREALYRVAVQHGVAIVEDDPYWLLAGDAPPPLATLSRGEVPVFYLSTLSKCLAPGLRTAYLVLPPGVAQAPVLEALRAIVLMPAGWMTALATHWINTGGAQAQLEHLRTEMRARQRLAEQRLPAGLSAHPQGLHCWMPLPMAWEPLRLVQQAQAYGLGVTAADAFSVGGEVPNAIRLSLGGAPDVQALAGGLDILAGILNDVVPQPWISGVV